MTYLLIALMVGLAIAPLMHFLPSKRQRLQARLREQAALSGLFVEFRDLPDSPAALERLPAVERQVLYYGKRLAPSQGKHRRAGSWMADGGSWRSVGERREVPSLLSRLGPEIQAVSIDESSCGVYWTERGDSDVVQQIAAVLDAWSDQV